MPLYEYYCYNCGDEFEKLMRFADPDIDAPECPTCQSKNTIKRLSMIASFGNTSPGRPAPSCGSSGGFS